MSGAALTELIKRADRILQLQRAAPQYHERVGLVRARLAEQHVHPDIIDRVIRLNPHLYEGAWLRGIHYKKFSHPYPMLNVWPWAKCVQRYGREFVDSLPKSAIYKRGKRKYVTGLAVLQHQKAA